MSTCRSRFCPTAETQHQLAVPDNSSRCSVPARSATSQYAVSARSTRHHPQRPPVSGSAPCPLCAAGAASRAVPPRGAVSAPPAPRCRVRPARPAVPCPPRPLGGQTAMLAPGALLFLALLLLLLFLLRLLWGTGSGPSPFTADARRPPAPIVTDKAVRRTVVKTVFSADKVPEGLDAIVVGSGIGGLAAAALLAKAGRRVLVLEQHGKLGGCCHTFTEKGYEFDTGIHYVGRMHEGSLTRFMLDQLTEGQLEWARLPHVYDAVVLGEPGSANTYRIYSGKREFYQGLKEQFPGEEVAIDEFQRLVQSASRGATVLNVLKVLPRALAGLLCRSGLLPRFVPFCHLATRSLRDVVDGLTTNPELRAVLCYIFPTYGTLPSKTSFSMHSLLVNHFLQGAWYPKGGSGEIAFHTINVIRKTGGNVLGRAPVQKILLDSQGRACGVSVKKGQDLVNIYAPVIISDAGIFNTYERLLPAEARALPGIQSQLRLATHGEGGFSVFVGLNGSREELGLEATNYYLYLGNDLDEIMNRYLSASREEAAKLIPFIFITCPSAKDPTWDTRYPGKSTISVLTFAKYEWFEEWKDEQVNKRGDDYEDLKKAFVDVIMQAVFKLYPRIEDRIEYISGGTPLTNQHYIASAKGEFYGMDHNIARLQAETITTLRPQTDVPNLYLTGQDLSVAGFMGAMHGAFMCASAVLKRNIYIDLMWLKRRTDAAKSTKKD